MIHSDTVVIGSGFAGLMSALVSAKKGKKVTLLTCGSGTLSLNSGTIDILGYDAGHKYVSSPGKAIPDLPTNHPYHRIGLKLLEESIEFFLKVTEEYGLPYHGGLDKQILVPTGIGTLKPTGLAVDSMDSARLAGMNRLVVAGIKGCKDFYGDMVAENIRKFLPQFEQCETILIDTGLAVGRDITTLDAARWMDSESGRKQFLEQLKPHDGADVGFLIPQILGTENNQCAEIIKGRIDGKIVETTCLAPSVNGLRLKKLLMRALRSLGVDIIEDTKVIGAIKEDRRCTAVIAKASVREKKYYANKFILATGGFYSGGITMREFDQPKEMIFNLPVWFPQGEENWSNARLFSDKPQGYASTGILTDESLCPVDDKGRRVYDNVHVVGRNLGGYDFCFEHSGNGVALASAYKAACL